MKTVWVLQHVHMLDECEQQDDVKFIGVFESEEAGFFLEEYKLNEVHWDTGFITDTF